ncbi:hypothetical protein EKN06_00650 [Croceicoccus ponticola]|uniref:Cytochrome c domain-containing protein n=1 Tax=Croceicoccus ponticola TaxID=2217664 RepID=A0A437GZI7_9SPHN|nr:c-type cytochrome [Croceicoccus ponticola]RVQ68778.1 hypothetical protein EKN06_00650 [Croceicoccus ponticola]
MMKLPVLAVLLLVAGACAPVSQREATAASLPAVEMRGLAFAQAHCSECHAVIAGQVSPLAEAPPFEAVVNVPGLTEATITPWLRNSHNFPDMMNFAIDPAEIDNLAAYMLSLQNRNYVPRI